MRGSIKLFRVGGIDIGVHYTWLLAFALITWSLAQGLFPVLSPRVQSVASYWIAGVIGSLLLFISVLLHELAHSFMANSKGLRVQGITLFIFGGVSNIEGEPEKPGIEFSMSIVGPLTSLVLGLIFIGIFFALQPGPTSFGSLFAFDDKGGLINALVYYIGYVNILLAIFNILPGFPLDGGRVLRSIIWGATNNLKRATDIAATTGRLFGWALIAYGVYSLFTGNWLGGIWIAFIGWFLSSAADQSRREVSLQEQLKGIKVSDVMDPMPECVEGNVSVETLVRENFIQRGRRAMPICHGGKLAGIVTLTDVKKLPQDRWSMSSVESIMTREPLYTVKKDDDLSAALKILANHGLNQVPVLSDGQLAGLLSRADIIRFMQMSQELGVVPKRR